jgi:hypothetical protein
MGAKALTSFRVFGKRYREVVRGWEASVRGGGSNVRRYLPSSLMAMHFNEQILGSTGRAQH